MPARSLRSRPLLVSDVRNLLTLAGAVVFFAATGLIAFLNIQTIRRDNDRVSQSQETASALNAILSSAQDAETGQRGYLLTGDDKYLAPYRMALADIPARLERIKELTSTDAEQQERLRTLSAHLTEKLAELRETIDIRSKQGLQSALSVVITDRGKADMDAIRSSLADMQASEASQRQLRFAEMNSAYTSAITSGVLSALLGIGLTIFIGMLIRNTARARQREAWLQSGRLELSAAMAGDQDVEHLGVSILQFLARYVGAQAGAMFVHDKASFIRASTYGVPPDDSLIQRFAAGEGLLGQVAADAKAIVLPEVPEGYLTIGSALGHDKPRYLLIASGAANGLVNGVIELGFFQPVDDRVIDLLEQASEAMGIALRSASYRAELGRLLEETQRQAESLQVQGEELRVSNEELEEQSRALKESQSQLEQQQVELEQTNANLEHQAQQLEVQRDELARANADIEAKAQEVQRASRYKSDFLANMSHELRTPLNSALILSKLLADNPRGNLTEEQIKFANTIHSSGNDLLTLINDILDLSKIEAGHIEIHAEPMSIDKLLADLNLLFKPVAEQKGLSFEAVITEGCPPSIESDRQRLEQILKNLLSNAFKFTEHGGVKLLVHSTNAEQMFFDVIDTGIGIGEEQQQRIFEAFQQADGTISRKYGGTGLGLSISLELARLLGGSVTVESSEGQGSTFRVTLPLQASPLAATPTPQTRAIATPATEVVAKLALPPTSGLLADARVPDDRTLAPDQRRSILVIEDDEVFAGIVRDMAHEMGFRCLIATHAEEALRLARSHLPAAIVLDVGLPDQSGLSVLDILKREIRTRHIPIHVVSASDHAHAALSLGALGYLVKPVRRDQLEEVLGKLEKKFSQSLRRVIVVEDDVVQRDAVCRLLASADVETVGVGSVAECLDSLKTQTFDCMVLDLSLPDASGFTLLETLSEGEIYSFPPVIVYTGHDITRAEEERLSVYSRSIIIKGAKSPERLLDEVTLFLHHVVTDLSDEQQRMIQAAQHRDAVMEGRRILVVEDDVRNVYALINILEPRGCTLEIARNGQEALDVLNRHKQTGGEGIDLVLMDVMMPVMDGLTATREIRQDPHFKKLPIIMLTAKAMPDDQEHCLQAGASDYMAKPLDVDKLVSLVRVWLAQ